MSKTNHYDAIVVGSTYGRIKAMTDYRGERIGLFSYNNAGEAGYADFGSFTYRYDSAPNR